MLRNNKLTNILHGENFLRKVETLPEGKTTKHKLFIVGHSETGHHHILESKQEFEVLEDKDDRVLIRLFGEGKLTHKKTFDIHETITVEPGVYAVTHKTEYNPFTKIVQRVFD